MCTCGGHKSRGPGVVRKKTDLRFRAGEGNLPRLQEKVRKRDNRNEFKDEETNRLHKATRNK